MPGAAESHSCTSHGTPGVTNTPPPFLWWRKIWAWHQSCHENESMSAWELRKNQMARICWTALCRPVVIMWGGMTKSHGRKNCKRLSPCQLLGCGDGRSSRIRSRRISNWSIAPCLWHSWTSSWSFTTLQLCSWKPIVEFQQALRLLISGLMQPSPAHGLHIEYEHLHTTTRFLSNFWQNGMEEARKRSCY